MKQREGDQALPVKNDRPDIQTLVIADIESRKAIGIERYGTALQPFNGRDSLRDAYEESIDLAMYLKQTMVEREGQNGTGHFDRLSVVVVLREIARIRESLRESMVNCVTTKRRETFGDGLEAGLLMAIQQIDRQLPGIHEVEL